MRGHVHLLECLDLENDATLREWKFLHRFAYANNNFNRSTDIDTIEGLVESDRRVTFTMEDGTVYTDTFKDIILQIKVGEHLPLFLGYTTEMVRTLTPIII